MTHEITSDQAGLEVGRQRFLHPGPLRWLRALAWMILLFVLFSVVYAGAQAVANPMFKKGGHLLEVLEVLAICCAGFGLYAVVVKLAEGRWPEELNLRQMPAELAIGLVIGALMLSAAVGGLYLLGVYDISGPRPASVWGTIAMAIESGFMEELIMRAILLRLLMRAFGIWPALVVQAALFGALHLANPNATPVAAAAIAVEAGLMLAGFYLLTGRLWMSVGVHAAWNFTQGWVWGASVSGIPVTESWLVSKPKPGAPEFLSGGAFGPEASLPAMVVGTLVAILVLWMAWKQGNFKARPDVTT
ncbi:CPBP family intramembrane glutamic endopeptidase [Caulobacter sp. FWC2]|uniref:CPBP family intramembrane glutamic endopeptidase n=1 Tax=Caulobacter sp. FWC2 TaxID=69664 RepID=UPI000C15B305|nr:type II CAAX endopeptidase family protein [Caulobacter sp. FWC2]PIB93239.1 CPBP family intramembrane metalloprotease domain-containing protein [Caulobacter sp. FWC2]